MKLLQMIPYQARLFKCTRRAIAQSPALVLAVALGLESAVAKCLKLYLNDFFM